MDIATCFIQLTFWRDAYQVLVDMLTVEKGGRDDRSIRRLANDEIDVNLADWRWQQRSLIITSEPIGIDAAVGQINKYFPSSSSPPANWIEDSVVVADNTS